MSTNKKKPAHWIWVVKITLTTFCLAFIFSTLSEIILYDTGLWLSVLIVLLLIIIGILADAIGVAVAAVDETAILAMCARKVKGAKQALKLAKNAAKVSSICNDVIGDICGIVSGASSAVIVLRFIDAVSWANDTNKMWITIALSGIIAALTVGGKAAGKGIALRNANKLIYAVGYVLSLFSFRKNPKSKPKKS